MHRRAALAALGGFGVGVLAGCSGSPSGPPTPPTPGTPPGAGPSATPTPGPVDPLTGAARVSTHPVVTVKIDNTAAARPQLGLADADHVWVQEVEAGLTRLVAVFHTTLPRQVGPVRSARSTDVELLGAYGAPLLVCSGANGDVTRRLARSGLPVGAGGAGFRRLGDRTAPYDLIADLTVLTRGRTLKPARSLGLTFAATDSRWAGADRLDRTTIEVGRGSQGFDHTDDGYRVSTAGRALEQDDRPVRTDNVVVLSVRNVADGNADVNGVRSVLSRTVGSGKVAVLRDGRRRTGTWTRRAADGRFAFTDAAGPITLRPGRTWFLLQG